MIIAASQKVPLENEVRDDLLRHLALHLRVGRRKRGDREALVPEDLLGRVGEITRIDTARKRDREPAGLSQEIKECSFLAGEIGRQRGLRGRCGRRCRSDGCRCSGRGSHGADGTRLPEAGQASGGAGIGTPRSRRVPAFVDMIRNRGE